MGRVDERGLKLLRARYQTAGRKDKMAMFDEFVKTTGYHRKHTVGC